MLAKPIMVRAAFYKGKGTLRDRLVRLLTRSRYSRVELLIGHRLATGWHAYAARGDNGQVGRRLFDIEGVTDDWDLLELPGFTKTGTTRWFKANGGSRFSLLQDIGLRLGVGRRFGSAAAAAHALDLQEYEHYTPGGLYRELVDHWAL